MEMMEQLMAHPGPRIMRIMDVLTFMLQIMMKMQIIMLVVNLNKTLILSCIQSTQGEIL